MRVTLSVTEIVLLGAALAIDAFAVSVANGIAEPRMGMWKKLLCAFFFGAFQFFMPLVGYACGTAFSSVVEKIAPYLSFSLLAFLGGKMIFDYVKERRARLRSPCTQAPLARSGGKGLTVFKLTAQAVATSIDALAAGVAMLAADGAGGLPAHIALCCFVIGVITFVLSGVASELGNRAGSKFTDEAGLAGGLVLVAIGIKLLLDGIL